MGRRQLARCASPTGLAKVKSYSFWLCCIQLVLCFQEAGAGAKPAKSAEDLTLQLVDGKFRDSRWQDGRWVLDKFKGSNGSMEWDKVWCQDCAFV